VKNPPLVRFILLFTLLQVGQAIAQTPFDPSTAALFKGNSSPEPEDLDSTRFTVTSPNPDKPDAAVKKKKQVNAVTADAPSPVAPPTTSPPAPAILAPTSNLAPAEHPSLGDQVKVLILGNDDQIEDFHKQIHPSDRRNNRVEIEVAPTYVYDSSASNYSFRQFTFQSPGLDVNAHVWLTPFFGLQVNYLSTFGATVMSPQAQQMVPLAFQDIEIGLRFRKHFGLQRRSSSLTWGLDFIQQTQQVPSDTVDRVSTSTSGLSLSLQADIPMGLSYSTFLGVELQPELVHSESSNANIHSGGQNEANAIGAWIGGDFIFDRQHQMFWKLHERIEQDVFDGTASTPDPVTNSTPSGVSITNSTTMFSIGYRWGS